MSTILDTIIAYKREEIRQLKTEVPINLLEKKNRFSRKCYSLKQHLKDPEKTGVIAEFKRKSPSKDVINRMATVDEVTSGYVQYGASGLSILTDTHFFGGSNHDLETAREAHQIPILRKDFIIDEYQILEAKAIGADVILLIAECLSTEEINNFTQLAIKLGMEVLLEMHSEEQLHKITPQNSLIGVNNRDLTTFQVDIDRSIKLAGELPKNVVKVAESGINDPAVVKKMRNSGFDGFLMGEHFMKTKHPDEAFRKFAQAIKRNIN